jgi:hypothetical protein
VLPLTTGDLAGGEEAGVLLVIFQKGLAGIASGQFEAARWVILDQPFANSPIECSVQDDDAVTSRRGPAAYADEAAGLDARRFLLGLAVTDGVEGSADMFLG